MAAKLGSGSTQARIVPILEAALRDHGIMWISVALMCDLLGPHSMSAGQESIRRFVLTGAVRVERVGTARVKSILVLPYIRLRDALHVQPATVASVERARQVLLWAKIASAYED